MIKQAVGRALRTSAPRRALRDQEFILRRRQIDPFFLVIVDRHKGLFTVEGPMTDGTEWNEAVCSAQKAGRFVTCSSGPAGTQSRFERDYARAYGLQLAPRGSIVDAPPLRSSQNVEQASLHYSRAY